MKTDVWRKFGILVFTLLISSSVSYADEGKISGYFFGDYYYVAKCHDEANEDLNGFQFRRIYMNYDRGLSDELSMRLRFEMNSPSFPDEKIKLEPFVKHAYLKWTNKDWRTNTYFGLSGTPTWATIEKFWGYRSVAKTLLDLQKIGGSTDFAVAASGDIDANKRLSYHAMVGNGTGTSGEIDQDKKAYFSLTAKPVGGVVAEAYADFENRDGSKDRYTVQGFVGYQHEKFRIGAQLANQTRKQGEGKDNLNILGGSVFGAVQVVEKKVWVLARFDKMFDPNPDGKKIAYTPYDNTAESNTVVFGIDWIPLRDVHIIPNLFLVFYDQPETGAKPDADIMPRLTLYYKY